MSKEINFFTSAGIITSIHAPFFSPYERFFCYIYPKQVLVCLHMLAISLSIKNSRKISTSFAVRSITLSKCLLVHGKAGNKGMLLYIYINVIVTFFSNMFC